MNTEQVQALIIETANRYGVDPVIALTIAQIESNFNPSAQNPNSSAGGVFQFIDSTWASYGRGNKMDAVANVDAGVRFIRDNMQGLQRTLGRAPTVGEAYLAHQQGLGGATRLLSNPSAPATDIVGAAAVRLNGGSGNMTAQDFANLWIDKAGQRSAQFGGSYIRTPATMGNMTPAANPTYNVLDDSNRQIGFDEIRPADPISDQEQRLIDLNNQQNSYSLLEGAGQAAWNNWSIFTPFRVIGGYNPDPNFQLTGDAIMNNYGVDIPEAYFDEFSDAVSDSHAVAIRERILRQMDVNQKIANMGTTGTVLSFGAALLDPGAIAATAAIGFATGGLGVAPAVAARFGRAGLVGLGAAEGVAGNVLVDLPLIAVDPTRDMSELKWSVGAGLLMGGAFGALRTNPNLQGAASQMTALGRDMQRSAVDDLGDAHSIGAARAPGETLYRTDTRELEATYRTLGEQTRAVFGRVRFDAVGSLLKSQNPMVRTLARYLGEDAARAGDGQVTAIAATERQARSFRVATYNWTRGYDQAWRKFRKANNISAFRSGEALRHFNQQVTDYIRETNPARATQFPDAVREAGDVFKTEMGNWWKQAREAGLARSEEGVENYFPRLPNLTESMKRIRRYGFTRDEQNGGLTELFTRSILSRQPDLDPKLARSMGFAILQRFNKLHAGENFMDMRTGSFDFDDLEGFLRETLDSDEVDRIKAYFDGKEPTNADSGAANSRLRSRIMLDEQFSMQVRNRETGVLEEVAVKDFYINDPNLVFHVYSRGMSGSLAMANLKIVDPDTGDLLIDGIKNQADWQRLKEQMKGVGQQNDANWTADERNLDFLYSTITGRPYFDETTDFATGLRMLRDFNFARVMGQVGLAQLPELGRIAGEAGIRTMWQAMPSFRQLHNLWKKGELGDDLSYELQQMFAPGTDWTRQRYFIEADDFGTPLTRGADSVTQRTANQVNPTLHQMNRFVAAASGMAPINGVLQRWGSRAFTVNMVKSALGERPPSVERLRALGLSEQDWAEVSDAIRTHARFRSGRQSGRSLEALNIRDWDANTAAKFEDALFRASRAIILENDPGQFAWWMQHPLSKTILQFRTFAVTAWTKATLRGLNHRDTAAAVGFMASSFIGAMVYMGQTGLNLIGDPEANEKWEERTTWGKLGMAAFQRTSESSLIPMAVDTFAEFAVNDPVFDFRSTGLASDGLFGNPTIDLFNAASGATSGLLSAAFGDDYSAPDYRNAVKVLPFQRVTGFVQFFNWLGSDLPRREIQDN
jgi:hypothetical protein